MQLCTCTSRRAAAHKIEIKTKQRGNETQASMRSNMNNKNRAVLNVKADF